MFELIENKKLLLYNDIVYSFFLDSVVGKLFAREQSSGKEKRVNFLVLSTP